MATKIACKAENLLGPPQLIAGEDVGPTKHSTNRFA
jgi:hypothetical protein